MVATSMYNMVSMISIGVDMAFASHMLQQITCMPHMPIAWDMRLWSSTIIFYYCPKNGRSQYERMLSIDGLEQDNGNSIALAMELLQSCVKLAIW